MTNVRQKAHNGVNKMMDKAENIKDESKEEITSLKEKAIKARENVDGYISDNPEKSILMAAGAGLVAGAIATAVVMKKKD
jgi:ElaB/YqjD/DUF883 family membrane-anchored ribosome-binding protein